MTAGAVAATSAHIPTGGVFFESLKSRISLPADPLVWDLCHFVARHLTSRVTMGILRDPSILQVPGTPKLCGPLLIAGQIHANGRKPLA
jgi:hypothetical protein